MINEYDLSGYVDGELSLERAQAVEQALKNDPILAQRLNELRVVDALLVDAAQTARDGRFLSITQRDSAAAALPSVSSTVWQSTLLALLLVVAKLSLNTLSPLIATVFQSLLFIGVIALVVGKMLALVAEDQRPFQTKFTHPQHN